jgi:hypothetical protein
MDGQEEVVVGSASQSLALQICQQTLAVVSIMCRYRPPTSRLVYNEEMVVGEKCGGPTKGGVGDVPPCRCHGNNGGEMGWRRRRSIL